MIQLSSTPTHVLLLPTAKLTGTITAGASVDSSVSMAAISSSTTGGTTNTSQVFDSGIFPVGTEVLHTATFPLGSYTVECFYGTAGAVDTSVASACVKNMIVKDDANTQ